MRPAPYCTSVRGEGIKGQRGLPIPLGRCTYLEGPNGTDKSSVADTLWLALLGYHPSAGREGGRVSDLQVMPRFAPAGATQTVAEATLDCDGVTLQAVRQWLAVRDDEGGLVYKKGKLELRGGGLGLLKDKEAQAQLEGHLGRPLFLDIKSWLAQSDDKRRLAIAPFMRCSWTEADLWTQAARWAAGRTDDAGQPLVPLTAAAVAAIFARPAAQELLHGTKKPWCEPDCVAGRMLAESGLDVRGWLALAHQFLRAIGAAHQAELEGLRRAIAELEGDPIDAHQVAELAAAHVQAGLAREQAGAAYQAQLEAGRQELAELRRRRAAGEEAGRQLAAVQRQLGALEQQQAAADGLAADLAAVATLTAEVEWGELAPGSLQQLAHEAQLAAQTTAAAEEAQAQAAQRQQATRSAVEAARQDRDLAQELLAAAVGQAQLALSAAHARHDAAKASLATVLQLIEADGGWGSPACPTCGQPVDGERVLPALRQAVAAAHREVEAAIRSMDQTMAEQEPAVVAARAALTAAQQAETAANGALTRAGQAVTSARQAQRLADGARQAAQQRLQLIQSRIAAVRQATDVAAQCGALRQQVADLTARAADATLSTAGAEGELQRLTAGQTAAVERAKADEDAALKALIAGQRRLEKKQNVALLAAELARAEEDRKSALAAAAVLGPRGLQGVLLDEGKAPLVAAVRQVLDPLYPDRRFDLRLLDDRGGDICQPGLWLADGSWAETTLSGGEAPTVQLGLQLGLQILGGAPYRLGVLDGAEAVDELTGRRSTLLRQLRTLQQAGIVDQVLVTCCASTPAAALEGWTVIRTGEQR